MLLAFGLQVLVAAGQHAGRVVDAAGEPVPGVAVTLYDVEPGAFCPPSVRRVGRCVTEATGAFVVPAPATPAAPWLQSVAWLEKTGYGAGVGSVASDAQARRLLLKRQAADLAGVVVDSDGNVVVGAQVWLAGYTVSVAAPFMPFPPTVRPAAVTDVYGAFRLPCPHVTDQQSSGTFRLVASHRRKGSAAQDVVARTGDQATVALKLEPYGFLAGKVQAAAGTTALPDRLGVQLLARSGFDVAPVQIPVAADGAFRGEDLPPGDYILVLAPDAAARNTLSLPPLAVTIPPGLGPQGLTPRLSAPAAVQLSVSDGDRPAAGVWLELLAGEMPLRVGPSDAAGRIDAVLPPRRFQTVRAYGEGGPCRVNCEPFTASSGVPAHVRVRVATDTAIVGTVLDEAGQPVNGAEVINLVAPGESTRSGADGAFRLSAAAEPVLKVTGPDGRRAIVVADAEPGRPVSVRLPAGQSLGVHVEDAAGQPIAGASLALSVEVGGRAVPLRQSATSREDGSVAFPAIPVGADLSLKLWHADYIEVSTVVPAAMIAEHQGELMLLVLRKSGVGVSGIVLDENDNPVRDVCVQALGEGQPYRKVRVDDAGYFVFEDLQPGKVFVGAVSCDGVRSHGLLPVEAGRDDVVLRYFTPREALPTTARVPLVQPPRRKDVIDREEAIYWSDFEDEDDPLAEWSLYDRFEIPDSGNTILGVFDQKPVLFVLDKLPPHKYVRVYWELYALDSWDGEHEEHGPDVWQARVVNGPRLVRSTFVAYEGTQSYPLPFRYGKMARGTAGRHVDFVVPDYVADRQWSYHVRYPMSFVVPHTDALLAIQFSTQGVSPKYDESWALDNVGVQLLDDWEAQPLDQPELERAYLDLGSPQGAVALHSMRRLIGAGDTAVTFLAEKLGWAPDADLRAALAAVAEAFAFDDQANWRDALSICRDLGPRAEAMAAWHIDVRRAAGSLPPWLEEVMSLRTYKLETDPRRLRAGRGAWVLERIWSPAARKVLMLDEVVP